MSCQRASLIAQCLRVTLHRFLMLSLCAADSSQVYCPVDHSCLGLLRQLALPPQLVETFMLCLVSLPLCTTTNTFSPGSNLGKSQGSSHVFPISQGWLSFFPDIQCHDNYCFLCFIHLFTCFMREVNLVPVTFVTCKNPLTTYKPPKASVSFTCFSIHLCTKAAAAEVFIDFLIPSFLW